jgi:putative NADH-flavin reductase
VDSPDFPPQYLQTTRDQAEALAILRAAQTPVAWSYEIRVLVRCHFGGLSPA